MRDNATAIYCFLDDYLKAIRHHEDSQRTMNDAEIMLGALLASLYFGGNYKNALFFLKDSGLCMHVLSRSRFSRRLNAIESILEGVFENVGQVLKEFNTSMEYVMDSFPVKVCHNIRIANNRLIPLDNRYRGNCASKREYFYGFKVQVIATVSGIPVEFAIVPGSWTDTKGMKALPMDLPQGSRNISDSGYTNYWFEEMLEDAMIWHDAARKSNSKRPEPAYRSFYKSQRRKLVETLFSQVTARMGRVIHATNIRGFILKIKLFIWSHSINALVQ